MHKISIYLAGNIQKGHEAESQIFWTDEDTITLQKYCKSSRIVFLIQLQEPMIYLISFLCSEET